MNYSITKLNDTNFETWLNSIKNICRADGCKKILEKEVELKSVEEGSQEDKDIGLAFYLINQSLNPEDELNQHLLEII